MSTPEIRDARFSDAADTWYHGLVVLVVGSPLAFLLGGAASALAIYHELNGEQSGDARVPDEE